MPVYEPEYSPRADGVILLGPPQIRDTRTFQPTYVPSDPKPSTPRVPPPPKLTAQLLPGIDVDPSNKKVRFGNKTETIKVDLDDEDREIEEEEDNDGQGIELPGYHTPRDIEKPAYDGPRFPPTIPHDEGYRHREYDVLHTGAIDWIEQELIARFMSQLQSQQTTVPIRQHRDVISARSSTSSSSDDRSLHDRLLDLLGQDGFQIFVDMGQPIDQDLIQALTREVLEERITQMIGFRSPRESIQIVQPPPAPPPRTITPTNNLPVDSHHHHPWPQDHSVPTPQPTPPQSPPPPVRPPRVATPEITGKWRLAQSTATDDLVIRFLLGQEVSSESEISTPRSITPQEDLDRPMPTVLHHSVGTPEPSDSPSPPSTPRPLPRPATPPRMVEKHSQATMTEPEAVPPPPPVIIPPPRVPSPPPSPPRPMPPKARTPSPVSSTSTSTSTSLSSSTVSSFSIQCSSKDSPLSDHQWMEDRSDGQIDPLGYDRPYTDLIMRQVERLVGRRRSSTTTAGLSMVSPPFSPAGGTHTLSIGEVPPEYGPGVVSVPQESNGHTTPSGSDESNHSGKSEGEITMNSNNNHHPQPIHIKYRRPTQGFVNKKNHRKT